MNLYIGRVVTISDDNKSGIIKCRVDGLYNSEYLGNISDEDLPNLYPIYSQNNDSFYSPKIGEEVFVFLDRSNKYTGFWFGKAKLSDLLLSKLSSDYEGFKSIVIDEEEKLEIFYSRNDGVMVKLDNSFVNIVNNEILVNNGDRVLHVKNGMISLGKPNSSDEPATLGDKNAETLNSICDKIMELTAQISALATAQSTVSASVPYLAPLIPAYSAIIGSLQSITSGIAQIKSVSIPRTKSTKVTLD